MSSALDDALTAVQARGLRLSTARRLVLQALAVADGPMSAEQVAAGVGGRVPPSDLASVYRNLDRLQRAGIVRHVHLGHGPGLWALAGGRVDEYLACERCGAYRVVSTRELDAVRAYIRRTFGYAAAFHHFPIVGLCADCVRATTERGEPWS
jgi:Fur family ferric uptake transcriptional regulator